MDIILLIIAIVFLCDKETKHSFKAIAILSAIGLVLTGILCATTGNGLFALDLIIYIIILLLCSAGASKGE